MKRDSVALEKAAIDLAKVIEKVLDEAPESEREEAIVLLEKLAEDLRNKPN